MRELNKAITKFKREVMFLALALIVMGVLFIAFPDKSTTIICYATGIAACIWGFIRLVAHFKMETLDVFGSYGLVQGAALIIVGVAIIANPEYLAKFITVAFGIIMLIDGILKIQYAIDLGRIKANGWVWVLVVAVLMIVLGVIAIVNPFSTAVTLMRFLGIILIADGISNIIIILYIVKSVKSIRKEALKAQRSLMEGFEEDIDEE